MTLHHWVPQLPLNPSTLMMEGGVTAVTAGRRTCSTIFRVVIIFGNRYVDGTNT
jgi:hypothetical protein